MSKRLSRHGKEQEQEQGCLDSFELKIYLFIIKTGCDKV